MGSTKDVHHSPGVDSWSATPLGTKLAERGRGKMIHLLPQHRLHTHTHTHTECGQANTQQTPCGWQQSTRGGVKTPRHAMKHNVM